MASFGSLIEGLTILAKYDKDGLRGHVGGADHDIIFGGNPEVSEEDKKRLDELGWHYSSEYGCWAHFC